MVNNYFKFDGKTWHQKDGTAMGTAVAPVYAILFLGAIEERIWAEFDKHIVLNTRFIDDGFVIWKPLTERYSFNRYLARLTQLSGLKFTKEEHEDEAVIQDLIVYWEGTEYLTRTHEKELNLYLYVSANSAHPRGVLKSIVFGRVLKFWKQNSKKEDFKRLCDQLIHRLKCRGYHPAQLKNLLKEVLHRINCKDHVHSKEENQLFLQLPFDPNGPDRRVLGDIFEFAALEKPLEVLNI